ncbi:hypothetical protein BCU94_09495 [Shewanella sp. 10N.286.52.C2]|uniref:hypothetical protein n=1 Tax=Shewanella sp. 10N.286.52.C2 TaxID=1880838 RepID=UPI000C844405|nr:hypothetical protein [Shewanella sp. 10N.286.52.C2]PMG31172.1 hypothetical protein BCU94_09495 [Shewanella sp. 10N.286.52.C2]
MKIKKSLTKKPKYYAVHVSYYPEYYNKSLKVLEDILKRISNDNYTILVVNNNESLVHKRYLTTPKNFYFIDGTNTSWEFSGWDEGVDFLTNEFAIEENDVFLFSNDTFCHHRSFTLLDELMYSNAISYCSCNDVAVGHVDFTDKEFIVFDRKVQRWISTFLFAMNYKVLRGGVPFSECKTTDLIINNNSIKVNGCNDFYNNHLSKWLLGEGWYKSESSDLNVIVNKGKAITNEKILSSKLNENDVSIRSVYSGLFFSLVRKFQIKVYNILKKSK